MTDPALVAELVRLFREPVRGRDTEPLPSHPADEAPPPRTEVDDDPDARRCSAGDVADAQRDFLSSDYDIEKVRLLAVRATCHEGGARCERCIQLTKQLARKIPAPVRKRILHRGAKCFYCGNPATEIDHVKPFAHGGTSDEDNLVAACRPCNAEKFDMTPEEWWEWRRRGVSA